MPPQLEKNHVVPTAWQDEALARDGVSREVPCSALKGETAWDPLAVLQAFPGQMLALRAHSHQNRSCGQESPPKAEHGGRDWEVPEEPDGP